LGEHTQSVIYKPIAGERPLWDFPDGNLAGRERAAFLLSEALHLNLVPYTILREGPFGLGMVQQWIEVDEELDVVAIAQGNSQKVRDLALFDAIINNTDRKFGHILIPSEGLLFACDHGITFHQDPKLRTVIWQFAGDAFAAREKDILERALEINMEFLETLITSVEIAALRARIETLLNAGTFPYPSEEWPSVPWPPF
jgi:uncharacterized repeat protein (TIGR03843 family)